MAKSANLACCGRTRLTVVKDLQHVHGFDFDLFRCDRCGRHWVYAWRGEGVEGWEEVTEEDARKMLSLDADDLRQFMREWAKEFD
jgi:hypothetical protein